jgi:HEAT repeat protein
MGPGRRQRGKPPSGKVVSGADILRPDRLENPIETLVSRLDSQDAQERLAAVRSLVRMCLDALGRDRPKAEALLSLFRDRSAGSAYPDVRLKCMAAISICGEPSALESRESPYMAALRTESPAILSGLESPAPEARKTAISRLGELCVAIRSGGETVPKSLIRLLSHYVSGSGHKDIRMGCIQVLFFCGEAEALSTAGIREGEDAEVVRYRDLALQRLSEKSGQKI